MLVPHSDQYLIFAPKDISDTSENILNLMNIRCGDVAGSTAANRGRNKKERKK